MEKQSLLASSLKEKNVAKASLEVISNELDWSNEKVLFILDMSFLSNDMTEVMQESHVEETIILEEDDKVDMALPVEVESKQIVIKENLFAFIDMVMPTYIKDKKVLLLEDLFKRRNWTEIALSKIWRSTKFIWALFVHGNLHLLKISVTSSRNKWSMGISSFKEDWCERLQFLAPRLIATPL